MSRSGPIPRALNTGSYRDVALGSSTRNEAIQQRRLSQHKAEDGKTPVIKDDRQKMSHRPRSSSSLAPSSTTNDIATSASSPGSEKETKPRYRSSSPNTNIPISPRSAHSEPAISRVVSNNTHCPYETALANSKRRIPYSLGAHRLPPTDRSFIKTNLSSDQEERLAGFVSAKYESLKPSSESNERRSAFLQKLERFSQEVWPEKDIKVHAFGSTENFLCTTDSDVDVCISTKDGVGMQRVVCVPRAKVPIVKIWDPELSVACDININSTLALENTKMIKTYVQIDERVRPLAMVIKYWVKRRILNDAAGGGTLSTYTWICMILNFLQMRNPPILPVLNIDSEGPRCLDTAEMFKGFGSANKESLGVLLFSFFRHFAHDFDYVNDVISVRNGAYLSKREKGWATLMNAGLCVEEPFNTSRNLGNSADDISVKGLQIEFRRAFRMISDHANLERACEQFVFSDESSKPSRPRMSMPQGRKTSVPTNWRVPGHNSDMQSAFYSQPLEYPLYNLNDYLMMSARNGNRLLDSQSFAAAYGYLMPDFNRTQFLQNSNVTQSWGTGIYANQIPEGGESDVDNPLNGPISQLKEGRRPQSDSNSFSHRRKTSTQSEGDMDNARRFQSPLVPDNEVDYYGYWGPLHQDTRQISFSNNIRLPSDKPHNDAGQGWKREGRQFEFTDIVGRKSDGSEHSSEGGIRPSSSVVVSSSSHTTVDDDFVSPAIKTYANELQSRHEAHNRLAESATPNGYHKVDDKEASETPKTPDGRNNSSEDAGSSPRSAARLTYANALNQTPPRELISKDLGSRSSNSSLNTIRAESGVVSTQTGEQSPVLTPPRDGRGTSHTRDVNTYHKSSWDQAKRHRNSQNGRKALDGKTPRQGNEPYSPVQKGG